MANPTEQEINQAHAAVDWSTAACSAKAQGNPRIAILFDDPDSSPKSAAIAKKICMSCPMLETCLVYAIKYETPTGSNASNANSDTLMGGYSRRERQKLKESTWWKENYEVKQ